MIKISIKNGKGNAKVKNGFYNVTANIPGYNNCSLNPKRIKVFTNSDFQFKVAAEGTLKIYVFDDNNPDKPICDATFIRTDKDGKEYGKEIRTDHNGIATFNYLPFGDDAPYVYFKQIKTKNGYDFNKNIQKIKLLNKCQTVKIKNTLNNTKTFTLTDTNYENLPLDGIITLR